MEQIKKDQDLVGRTIEKQGYADNTFALFFNDNTFAIFRGCGWEETDDVELMGEDYNLEPNLSNCCDLKDLGVIDETEYEKVWDDYNAKKKIKNEEKERLQYEKLRLKYKD